MDEYSIISNCFAFTSNAADNILFFLFFFFFGTYVSVVVG